MTARVWNRGEKSDRKESRGFQKVQPTNQSTNQNIWCQQVAGKIWIRNPLTIKKQASVAQIQAGKSPSKPFFTVISLTTEV